MIDEMIGTFQSANRYHVVKYSPFYRRIVVYHNYFPSAEEARVFASKWAVSLYGDNWARHCDFLGDESMNKVLLKVEGASFILSLVTLSFSMKVSLFFGVLFLGSALLDLLWLKFHRRGGHHD